jgi:3-hydroxyacyl-CoA dehydrogenase / enoyl-CoA hydratase / 3-hydroxybutyryl-CoA epimerase
MNKHWKLETDESGIVWLHFDHLDSPVNILSHQALEEFDNILTKIETDQPSGLIILSDKTSGFIAGADVKTFRNNADKSAIEQHITGVHKIFQRLENLTTPTLALIHGFCLGGGLELALACRYRIARDDEATRLGFPEVKLGLFPGYGGSVRSIERIGPLPALNFMLTGRSVSGRTAKGMGLVDRVAPDRQLKAAAIDLISNKPPQHKPPFYQSLLNLTPVRPLLSGILEKEVRKRALPEHYPAPFALIDHWKEHANDRKAMFASEATNLANLLSGDTSQNLIRIFFLQERMKSLAGDSDFKPTRLHVVGGGIMGGDIAAWCALKGMRVTLQDREAKYLTNAIGRAHQLFNKKLKQPRLVQAAMDRLMPDPKGYGASHADVVIEAIFEDVAAKQELFRDLESKVRPDTLLATNTSSIPLETISQSLKNPQRLIGLHFFNPVAKMQLVEVVHGKDTDPELIKQGAAFARRVDRLPLPVKSSPGFLINRILMPYLLEAMELLSEGVPAKTIDQAATNFGMPMGPIELADRVGLDICLAVADKLSPFFNLKVPERLEIMVEQKNLGAKTGAGFYHYKNGKAVYAGADDSNHIPGDLADRMIFRMLNEAVACLREQIVEDADLLDAGIIFGTGFAPFHGGPMNYINKHGKDKQQQRLQQLEQIHGETFHPDPGWDDLPDA